MVRVKRLVFFIGLISVTAIAQNRDKIENLSNFDKEFLRWGYYVGLNYNDFKVSYKAPEAYPNAYVETKPSMGFNIGLIGDMRLHKNINLRIEPGLMSNRKTLYFRHLSNEIDSVRNANSAFLHVPLLVQLSTDRIRNIRPYVAGGVAYDYNFAHNFNNPDDNFGGEFRMQKHAFMCELGIGMDFYFPYFKFSPSIRGVFAMTNEIKEDNTSPSQWTTPVDFFGTRGVFFRMTFQ